MLFLAFGGWHHRIHRSGPARSANAEFGKCFCFGELILTTISPLADAMTVHVLSLLHGRQIFGSINSEDKCCRLPAVRFL